ncbi:uncharacterized protein [Typha latifolia]|uniref:uncharacterized protein isoform X2 n=1 Tax=Typha latifolia TaxID=4733 RepID=UPI003C2E484E
MDTGQGDERSKHKNTHPEGTSSGDDEQDESTLQNKHDFKKEASCSPSSSSEDSSDEDFFQLDVSVLVKPVSGNNEATSDFTKLPRHGYDHHFKTQNGASDVNPKPDRISIIEPKQSPPIQVMSILDAPDPNRIPSSIFATTPASHVEWSVASNESLFSINVGNSSFRDNTFLFNKSGDLTTYPCSPFYPFAPMPPISDTSTTVTDVASETEMPIAEASNSETSKDALSENVEEPADSIYYPAEGVSNRTSSSHRSDGSMTSFHSFAFPILTARGNSGSLKVKPQSPLPISKRPHQQPAIGTSKVAAARTNRWFPCCSCCQFCC